MTTVEIIHTIVLWGLMIPFSIWIWTPHFNRPDKVVRNYGIWIAVQHISAISYFIIGDLWWAVFWILMIMLTIHIRRKRIEHNKVLKDILQRVDVEILDFIANEYDLDRDELEIRVEKNGNRTVYYQGKPFRIKGYDEEEEL
jgi:hypothetical protein